MSFPFLLPFKKGKNTNREAEHCSGKATAKQFQSVVSRLHALKACWQEKVRVAVCQRPDGSSALGTGGYGISELVGMVVGTPRAARSGQPME